MVNLSFAGFGTEIVKREKWEMRNEKMKKNISGKELRYTETQKRGASSRIVVWPTAIVKTREDRYPAIPEIQQPKI